MVKGKAMNYRLISVTCIPSNPVEHLLVSNIYDFFDCHRILALNNTDSNQNTDVTLHIIGFTQEIADSQV